MEQYGGYICWRRYINGHLMGSWFVAILTISGHSDLALQQLTGSTWIINMVIRDYMQRTR